MNELWIKIKFWTKTTLFSLLLVYILVFIYCNSGSDRTVKFWWWFKREPETSVFTLAFMSFLAGSVVTLLVRTTLTTMKQWKQAKIAQLQRERDEQAAKASKLRTTVASSPGTTI